MATSSPFCDNNFIRKTLSTGYISFGWSCILRYLRVFVRQQVSKVERTVGTESSLKYILELEKKNMQVTQAFCRTFTAQTPE